MDSSINKINFKNIIIKFFAILSAILIFTFLDWIVHQSFSFLAVPKEYFTNKIIYGVLWAFLASLVFRKKSIPVQAALITIITVALLQVRYFLYGYSWLFQIVIIPMHLILLYLALLISLKLFSRIK